MQWNDEANAGFTTGKPWLPVNPNYTRINAQAALQDPDSVFWYYKRLIELRKSYAVFAQGDFTLLEENHPHLFVYQRCTEKEQILVVCNFAAEEVPWERPDEWKEAKALIANYPQPAQGMLRPWEAVILYRER